MQTFYIAELNIARLRAPLDTPLIADFKNGIDQINALAESQAHFVWRLKDEDGDATNIRLLDDPLLIINLSLWQSIDALFQYTYSSEHVDFFRRRAEWFERTTTPHLVLWWQTAGEMPTLSQASERLSHLTQHGPTPFAFTFKQRFSIQDWHTWQHAHA